MSIQLGAGEKILKEGPANHLKGRESVGGALYLTNQRLVFKSHAFNVQVHEESYMLDSIRSAQPRNTLGLIPNGLAVTLADGSVEKFVIWGRQDWIHKIMQARPR